MSEVTYPDREAWLTDAAGLIIDEIIIPVGGVDDPPEFRISVGFPKGSRGGRKAIAVTYPREASADGRNEIFISPELDDAEDVLALVAHELIHAVLDCEGGHRGKFAEIAEAIGFERPFPEAHPGEVLTQRLQDVAEQLGGYPHARLTGGVRKHPTRSVKIECSECGWVCRASPTQVHRWPQPTALCPVCEQRGLVPKFPE